MIIRISKSTANLKAMDESQRDGGRRPSRRQSDRRAQADGGGEDGDGTDGGGSADPPSSAGAGGGGSWMRFLRGSGKGKQLSRSLSTPALNALDEEIRPARRRVVRDADDGGEDDDRPPSVPDSIPGSILGSDQLGSSDRDTESVVSEMTLMTYTAERAVMLKEEFIRQVRQMDKAERENMTASDKLELFAELQARQESRYREEKEKEKFLDRMNALAENCGEQLAQGGKRGDRHGDDGAGRGILSMDKEGEEKDEPYEPWPQARRRPSLRSQPAAGSRGSGLPPETTDLLRRSSCPPKHASSFQLVHLAGEGPCALRRPSSRSQPAAGSRSAETIESLGRSSRPAGDKSSFLSAESSGLRGSGLRSSGRSSGADDRSFRTMDTFDLQESKKKSSSRGMQFRPADAVEPQSRGLASAHNWSLQSMSTAKRHGSRSPREHDPKSSLAHNEWSFQSVSTAKHRNTAAPSHRKGNSQWDLQRKPRRAEPGAAREDGLVDFEISVPSRPSYRRSCSMGGRPPSSVPHRGNSEWTIGHDSNRLTKVLTKGCDGSIREERSTDGSSANGASIKEMIDLKMLVAEQQAAIDVLTSRMRGLEADNARLRNGGGCHSSSATASWTASLTNSSWTPLGGGRAPRDLEAENAELRARLDEVLAREADASGKRGKGLRRDGSGGSSGTEETSLSTDDEDGFSRE